MREDVYNLTFHGVGVPPRPLEAGEDRVWISADRFRAILDLAVTRTDLHLTFDDGNASDLEIALPELVRRKLKAEFYVVAGRLDTPGFVGAAQIRALLDAGMTIGCHGMLHRRWRGLADAELREEIVVAKDRLEQAANQPIRRAACPFGAYDRRVLAHLRCAGYDRVFTSDRGWAAASQWLQPRNSLVPDDDTETLTRMLRASQSGMRPLVRRVRTALKRWR